MEDITVIVVPTWWVWFISIYAILDAIKRIAGYVIEKRNEKLEAKLKLKQERYIDAIGDMFDDIAKGEKREKIEYEMISLMDACILAKISVDNMGKLTDSMQLHVGPNDNAMYRKVEIEALEGLNIQNLLLHNQISDFVLTKDKWLDRVRELEDKLG